jgi:predicted ATPase
MLQSIKLENFQSVGELTTIPLGRITLIFGPNGAGKSSIFRALKLAQSNLDNLGGKPLIFSQGETDLIGYKNVVFGHKSETDMKIGFQFKALDLWSDFTTHQTIKGKRPDPGWAYQEGHAIDNYEILFTISNSGIKEFNFVFNFRDRKDELNQKNLKISFKKEDDWELGWTFDWHLDLDNLENFPELFRFGKMLEDSGLWSTRVDALNSYKAKIPREPSEFPNLMALDAAVWDGAFGGQSSRNAGDPPIAVPDYEANTPSNYVSLEQSMDAVNAAISECVEGLKFNLEKFKWLGPLRKSPTGLSYGSNQNMTGDSNFIDSNEVRELLVKAVSKWLFIITERFKYSENVIASELGEQIVEQLVVDTASGVQVGFDFVGIGLSQILPVLIEGFSEDSKILLIEQPELHLHPRAQSEVADFLIEASRGLVRDLTKTETNLERLRQEISEEFSNGVAREKRQGTKVPEKQIIVETHSENMILRFQKRIREGSLNAEDLTVLYVQPTEEGSKITKLRLSDTGEFLDKWPQSFQEIRLDDLLS